MIRRIMREMPAALRQPISALPLSLRAASIASIIHLHHLHHSHHSGRSLHLHRPSGPLWALPLTTGTISPTYRGVHGAILSDQTGFGKTKVALWALLLYCILARPKKPNVLLVPGTLMAPGLMEIKDPLAIFESILSYSEHTFKDTLGTQRMTKRQIKDAKNDASERISLPFPG